MPVRSIIDVEVNNQQFDAFLEKWKKYQEDLAKQPSIWQRISGQNRAIGRDQEQSVGFLRQIERSWDKMRDSTGAVVRNVREISSRLLHVAGLMATVTGIATVGGFFGMDVLGRQASSWRRGALGGGTSIGGMRAFGLDFSRFIDPASFLGGVGQAMRDPSRSVALRSLGITPQAGEDTASVAANALERIQRLAKSTPEGLLGSVLQSHRLGDLGVSLEDLTRLRSMSTEELREQQRQFRGDRGRLNLTDSQAKGWQDFTTVLERARASIETTFVTGLSPLAPALGKLSTAITHTIDVFLSKPQLQKWLDDMAQGIEHFATYIGSPDFEHDVERTVDNLRAFGRAIGDAVDWIRQHLPGGIGAPTAPPPAGTPGVDPRGHYEPGSGTLFNRPLWRNPDGSLVDTQNGRRWRETSPHIFEPAAYHPGGGSVGDRETQAHDFFRRMGWGEDANAGLLAYIRGESGFNPGAFNPAGGGQGAQGIGQWRGARIDQFRRMFGHDPRNGTFEEQLAFMQWELQNTERRTGDALQHPRSARDAAADVLRLYGRPSPGELPGLTTQRGGYADEYRRHFGGPSTAPAANVIVTIRNETGGNMVTSTSQVAV